MIPRAADGRRADSGWSSLVLCYHAVSETWNHSLSVAPDTLTRQLRVLLRRYRPVSVEALLAGARRGIHVTFDDAFASVADAVPILQRLGVPATIFVCTDLARDGSPFTVPELAAEVDVRPAELATLDWGRLRDLVAAGIEIGSHTQSHPHLPGLEDAELDSELRDSRELIEDELRVPCRYVAYPYGDHDERVRAAARAAGYRAAFALPGQASHVDQFALPRLGLWRHDGILRTAAKVAFAHGRERRRAPT